MEVIETKRSKPKTSEVIEIIIDKDSKKSIRNQSQKD